MKNTLIINRRNKKEKIVFLSKKNHLFRQFFLEKLGENVLFYTLIFFITNLIHVTILQFFGILCAHIYIYIYIYIYIIYSFGRNSLVLFDAFCFIISSTFEQDVVTSARNIRQMPREEPRSSTFARNLILSFQASKSEQSTLIADARNESSVA